MSVTHTRKVYRRVSTKVSKMYSSSRGVLVLLFSIDSASLLWEQPALDVSCTGSAGQGDITLSLDRITRATA